MLNLIAQHVCFEETAKPFMGIWDDLYNVAASVAKLDLLMAHQSEVEGQAGRMVITEVEYLAVQCRSIFDYLQRIIKAIWSKVRYKEDGSSPKKTLPNSFGDMVIGGDNKPRTAAEIEERFMIPQALAFVYARHAPFFANLRTMRDAIVHKGSPTPVIFTTQKGAYIESTLWPFSAMTTWRSDEFEPNSLVPLKPALGAMIYLTLLAAEELIHTYSLIVELGHPLCPNHALFLRASSGKALADLLADADKRYVPPPSDEQLATVLVREGAPKAEP
ncbi:hypothetical protein RKE25_10920 [Dyella sp. BiH032]|uniref:hypothetical protein n=1 Tax=Dyella sp. BiH032 TaxID=3075430 RepID=UPI002892D339|nr:hypothetical protein [Dyella sp. BiH032]WNL48103.1 hypothetical protein RKE25_10920 [Dyella sp. BiH032]